MPRGGRRPGAGAPRGNLNALKTGERSRRVQAVIQALMLDSEARQVFLTLGARGHARDRRVSELALTMARFMNDRPVIAEARRRVNDLAHHPLAKHQALTTD